MRPGATSSSTSRSSTIVSGGIRRWVILARPSSSLRHWQRELTSVSARSGEDQFSLFARWTRLGLWRRLLARLRRPWRLACGDTAEPSTVVIGSRSCRSAPSCFTRGIDGGKKIKGVKIQVAVEKYGLPLAIDVSPANTHDTKGIVPVLQELAD